MKMTRPSIVSFSLAFFSLRHHYDHHFLFSLYFIIKQCPQFNAPMYAEISRKNSSSIQVQKESNENCALVSITINSYAVIFNIIPQIHSFVSLF